VKHDFPADGVKLTVLRVVSDLEQARHFYRDVLGAQEIREYGGTSGRFAASFGIRTVICSR